MMPPQITEPYAKVRLMAIRFVGTLSQFKP
jgi:hypothetical protein